jgi:hypothetical protein
LQAEGRGFESRHLHNPQVNALRRKARLPFTRQHPRLPASTALHDTLTGAMGSESDAPDTAVGIGSVEETRGTCQLSAAGSTTDSWLHWRPFGWLLAAGRPLGVLLGDQPLDGKARHQMHPSRSSPPGTTKVVPQ